MKYGEDTNERLGQVPIVIVAHSLGGLVFKRACKYITQEELEDHLGMN